MQAPRGTCTESSIMPGAVASLLGEVSPSSSAAHVGVVFLSSYVRLALWLVCEGAGMAVWLRRL